MSQPDPSKKAGATFTWVLGAFAGFAVLFILIQAISDSKKGFDPRAKERSDNTAEILAAQSKSIATLGLDDEAKKKALFKKTLADLGAKKPGVSTQVVPGSPTQLKQAAASMPPAAPAAPAAPAVAPVSAPPAAPPAPVPAAPVPTPPAPAPAPAPAAPVPTPPAPAPAPVPAAPVPTPPVPAPAPVPAPPVPTTPAPAPAVPAPGTLAPAAPAAPAPAPAAPASPK